MISIPYLGLLPAALGMIGRAARGVTLREVVARSRDASGPTPQITTITVDSASNSSPYGAQITSYPPGGGDGYTEAVSITSDGDATTGEIATALGAAITANGNLAAAVSAAVDSDDVVLTWADGWTGSVVLTGTTGDLSQAATQEAAPAPQYYYGRACQVVEAGQVQPVAQYAGSTITLTIVHDAGDTYTVSGVYHPAQGDPEAFSFDFDAGGSAGATDTAAAAAAEAEWPDATVTNPSEGSVVIALAAGARAWDVVGVSDDAGTVTPVVTAPAFAPRLHLVVQDDVTGSVEDDYDSPLGPRISAPIEHAGPSGSTEWIVPATVTTEGPVWVSTATATLGRLYPTDPGDGSVVPWPEARFLGPDPEYPGLARLLL